MKQEFQLQRVVNPFIYAHVNAGMENPTIPAWLHESYGQCYDDVVVCGLIKAFAIRSGLPMLKLSYIEIGANHPVCTSASFLLYRTFGVTGVLVEPNPKLAAQLRKHRPFDNVVEAAVVAGDETEVEFFLSPENEISSTVQAHVERWNKSPIADIKDIIKVPAININALLNPFSSDVNLFVSIDVEGADLAVLKSIDFASHRPLIIQIEPSEDANPGNTQKITEYLASNNYTLVSMNFVNLIFHDKNRL